MPAGICQFGGINLIFVFPSTQLSDLRDVEEEWERACREGREMTEELGRWRADVSSVEARIDQCGPTLRYIITQ